MDQINPVSHFLLIPLWGALKPDPRTCTGGAGDMRLIVQRESKRLSAVGMATVLVLLEYLIRLCEDRSSAPSSAPSVLTLCYLKQTLRLESSSLMFLVNQH